MNIGGAEAVVSMLASGLVASGFSVVVFSTHSSSSLKTIFIDGVKVIYIPPHNLFWYLNKNDHSFLSKVLWHFIDLWNLMMFLTVRSLMQGERPDIIHFHKLTGFSPSIWLAARRSGCRALIQTCHDFELLCPETSMQGKIGEFVKEKKWIVQPYLKWRSWLSRSMHAFTAPSQYALDIISSYDFFESASKKVIPNSHGFSRNQCKQLQDELELSRELKGSESLRVLFIGRLTEIKGADILCKAISACLEDGRKISLDVAGTGRQEMPLRKQYEGEKRINFHGHVVGKQKDALLRAADLMVVPSNCPEVFGIVIVEAFAYGLPVLATNVGGIPELIEPGKTGFLVSAGDVGALSEILGKIADNRYVLDDMTSNCFEAALKFCSEDITQSYISLYVSIVGEHVPNAEI